ncbi:glucose-6-phosphate dehydrogenase [Nanoarchaeota archaeon]
MDCTFIIFGATGDLASKKIFPAIYYLKKKGQIRNFSIVAIGRRDLDIKSVLEKSKKYIKNIDTKIFSQIVSKSHYFQLDFDDKVKYNELGKLIEKVENKNKSTNRLFYLATLPNFFEKISENLAKCGLVKNKGWSRIVFEKPFGENLQSARRINKTLKKIFKEDQIYRIDHYLGKELVQNILFLRFTNSMFESILNKEYVDHVQIILSEKIGIKGREGYYDQYGALKDVVQNHMFQILSLISMEAPKKMVDEKIRDEKVKVLKKARIEDVVLGQYKGYLNEKDVRKNSRTETFAALEMSIVNSRWRGVPFYLFTGKAMKKSIATVHIQFKKPKCLMGVCNYLPNYLSIQLAPEEGFYMQLNAKAPGVSTIVPVKMEYCHNCTFGPNTPRAYENLLVNILEGDKTVFVRTDEIEEAWDLIDKIKKNKLKVFSYKKGSYPLSADSLIKSRGSWHLKEK